MAQMLWLWPAAVTPIRSLAWEPPHAEGGALKKPKKKKKKKKKKEKKKKKKKKREEKKNNAKHLTKSSIHS